MVLEENVMNYIALVLILLTVKYLFNLVTNYLDWKSMKNPVPANVKDIFSAEEYQKWKSYHSEKVRLSILSSTFDYIITVLAFAFCLIASGASQIRATFTKTTMASKEFDTFLMPSPL